MNSDLKKIILFELKSTIKSTRFLFFSITYILSLLVFNLFYYTITEKEKSIAGDPFYSQQSFETAYRNFVKMNFQNNSEFLRYILDIDPILTISYYLLLTCAPFFLILLVYPSISHEIQNRSYKYLLLFSSRANFYLAKFISALVIVLPIFLLFNIATFFLNANRLIAVDIADQLPILWGFTGLSMLYIISFTSLLIMVSALVKSTYSALGFSFLFWYVSMIFENTSLNFLAPTYYRSIMLFPGAMNTLWFIGAMVLFTSSFFAIGMFIFHRKDIT